MKEKNMREKENKIINTKITRHRKWRPANRFLPKRGVIYDSVSSARTEIPGLLLLIFISVDHRLSKNFEGRIDYLPKKKKLKKKIWKWRGTKSFKKCTPKKMTLDK